MRSVHVPSWVGVALLAVGLFTAFVLGDFIPGMVLAGFIIAFTGMMAIHRGDAPPSQDKRSH